MQGDHVFLLVVVPAVHVRVNSTLVIVVQRRPRLSELAGVCVCLVAERLRGSSGRNLAVYALIVRVRGIARRAHGLIVGVTVHPVSQVLISVRNSVRLRTASIAARLREIAVDCGVRLVSRMAVQAVDVRVC